MGDRDFRVQRIVRAATLSGVLLLTAACDDDDSPPPPPTYTVGGAVSGLNGSVTLVNANGDARTVTANGSFAFGTPLRANTNYAVTVQTQPANQHCTVTNGSGSVAASNITNIVVACETIRVTATIGAAGGALIGPDGVEVEIPPLALSEDTVIGIARSSAGAPTPPSSLMQLGPIYEFTPHDISFREPVKIRIPVHAGATELAVLMAGQGEDFSVVDAQFTNGVAEIFRVTFSWGAIVGACFAPGPGDDPYGCVAPRGHSTLSSTPANALIAMHPQYSQARNYQLNDAGTVHFRLQYKAQADCLNMSSVRVRRARVQPNGAVIPPLQTVVEQGASLTLDEPGTCVGCWQAGQPSTVYTASGVTTLNVPHTHADNGAWFYSMQFICTRRGVTRTYADAATINIDLAAPVVTHSIGGTVTGLSGAGLVLQNNGADDLTINAAGAFTFSREIGHGDSYNVTVRTQPSGQVCTVSNGGGTAQSAVTNIAVNCVTSASRSWRSPQVLASAATNLMQPQVVFDSYGNAMAAWIANPAHQQAEIWVARYNPSIGWRAPTLVASTSDGAITDLNLATASGGEAVLVWEQRDQDHHNIFSSRRGEGGWSTPEEIDDLVVNARDPRLAVNEAGIGYAVWLQGTGGGDTADVWAARLEPGSGWGAAVRLDAENGEPAVDPRIAVNLNGDALAAWAESESSIAFARYDNSGWSAAATVASGVDYYNDELELAMDDYGGAVLAYTDSANSGAVYAHRFTGAWSAQDVLKANAWAPRGLRVAMDWNGAAMVAWVEGEVGHQIWARPYGSLTGASQNVGNGNYSRLDVEWDADGSALMVWSHDLDDVILASRCTFGADCVWSTPVEAVNTPAYAPQLAIDSQGNAIVVWGADESAGDMIGASEYR